MAVLVLMSMCSKCNKFVVGKKSALGGKAATKRNENAISWDRLPFATAALLTSEDVEAQKATVCIPEHRDSC
jgi:hypothetical protein